MEQPSTGRRLGALVVTNVLGGIGVASGIAVGALLVESLGGTALAGVGQALSVLGAALLAVPLANLAARAGRGRSLALGYAIAAVGGLLILAAARLGWFPLLLVGLLLFGAAQATNLQTRYAASELASPERRATVMSVVIWATTIGSVLGPNLTAPGAALGRGFGLPDLAGPYLFSLAGFVLAWLSVVFLHGLSRTPSSGPARAKPDAPVGALAALRWANGHPVARFAVALIVVGHMIMVAIMSMTPLHLRALGHELGAVGLVISLHIAGMYALSPVVGWLADRVGAMRTALVGLVTFGITIALILLAGDDFVLVTVALFLLGLGWSFTMISGSALLAGVDSGDIRVPLQGATDALMNYGGAAAAVASGPLLATIGFGGLAVVAGLLVLPAALVGWFARRHRDAGFAADAQR